MPDSSPASLPTSQVLDESLAALFARLQAEPAPAALLRLVDALEDAWARSNLPVEARSLRR